MAHSGARLGAMGGSEGGVRGRLTRVCECVVKDGQVWAFAVAKNRACPLAPPPSRRLAVPSGTTSPRRRELVQRGGGVLREM
jgi:hypothetical protein